MGCGSWETRRWTRRRVATKIPHTGPNYLIHVIAHRVFPATGYTLRARDARASVQPSSICPTLTLVALAASDDQERRQDGYCAQVQKEEYPRCACHLAGDPGMEHELSCRVFQVCHMHILKHSY
jgi:hypothetical protein